MSCHWANKRFRYLNITLTTHLTQLFHANYTTGKLIKQLKNDLTHWEVLPLSPFSRVGTIKMNLLLGLLFLFQPLLIRDCEGAKQINLPVYLVAQEI